MGVLFDIHNELGSSLLEKHYQKAIETRLTALKIPFEREKKIALFFDEQKLGDLFIDFVIDKKIILETKCIPKLSINDIKQTLRYLETTKIKLGILANFKGNKLEFRRILR